MKSCIFHKFIFTALVCSSLSIAILLPPDLSAQNARGSDRNFLNLDFKDEHGNSLRSNDARLRDTIETDAFQQRVLNGTAADDNFGYSVSGAGDVNGDGYNDIIVGSSLYNASVGRAYIYFGGAVMNNVADLVMTGTYGNGRFGSSVCGAGDMNGDGFADVLVSAPNAVVGPSTGTVEVFLGGPAMD